MSGLGRALRVALMLSTILTVSPVVASGQALPMGVAGSDSVRYVGVTVCADCSGIRTTLVLDSDAEGAPTTYTMTEVYEGRSVAPRKTSGTWTILRGDATHKNATVYQLHTAGSKAVTSFLKANEDELQMLDGSLRALPASVPHTLRRVRDAATEKTGAQ